MAENEVFITAVITPAEGKADRVEELLRAVVDDVKKNEPATMQYQLHKKLDGQGDTQFVVIERYESAKAVEKHKEGEAYKALFAAAEKEGLVGSPAPVIIEHKPLHGFQNR